MKIFKIVPLLLAVMISSVAIAQKNFTEEADAAYEAEQFFGAIEMYKKAYSKEKNKAKKAEILFRIGECYKEILDDAQAEVWLKKAITAQYPDAVATLHLADVLKHQERYDEAQVEYDNYLKLKPGDSRGTQGSESCKLAQEWKDNPTKHEIHNEVLINSKENDYSPTFADRKRESLIFASDRPGATGDDLDTRTGESFPDLYYSKKDKKGKWSTPTPLNETVNTTHGEGPATLDSKTNEMYFTRCEVEKKETRGCLIYKTKRMGNNWGEAEFVDLKSDSLTVGHPALSSDDDYLFFASDMEGGKGGKDIWYIKYDKKAKIWGDPINLSSINTEHNELFPFSHEDGSLYFASDGHLGLGGLDIFKAEKAGDDQWGNVQNMKYPINSAGHDFAMIFEGKKEKGYFTSNRRGGKGGDDIYSFYVAPVIYVIQGNVYDIDSKEPIEGATVKLIGNDGTSVEVKTDQTGFYQFGQMEGSKDRYVQPETSYQIEATREKFLGAKGEQTTVGFIESTTFQTDFSLQGFAPDKEIEFPEVLYDLGKWELRPESKDSLNFLYQVLIDNPTIVIELSAHTDSRGSDESNETLSQKRAQSCVDYLIEKGIDSERLLAKGYGERKLIFSDADIEKFKTKEEQEAAHQKNRRTVFSVIRDDFAPKPKEPAPEEQKPEGEGSDN